MMLIDVRVQTDDFDVSTELKRLQEYSSKTGAVVNFVGFVRDNHQAAAIQTLELEHYPGMTENAISNIVDRAAERWRLLGALVIHRVGPLQVGDQIVLVAISSQHRGDAFQACEFVMDYLKTEAPFWKKEITAEGERWVDARDSDYKVLDRWR